MLPGPWRRRRPRGRAARTRSRRGGSPEGAGLHRPDGHHRGDRVCARHRPRAHHRLVPDARVDPGRDDRHALGRPDHRLGAGVRPRHGRRPLLRRGSSACGRARSSSTARRSTATRAWRSIWTAIPAIVLVALCAYAYVVADGHRGGAKAGEQRINVNGQQFAWTFEYPQGAGKDPVRSNQLYLKETSRSGSTSKSRDVIHDFWVPAFRMKIDAVPGITTNYRVTPDRPATTRSSAPSSAASGTRSCARPRTSSRPPSSTPGMAEADRARRAAGRRRAAARRTARRSSPTATAPRPPAAPATRWPTRARARDRPRPRRRPQGRATPTSSSSRSSTRRAGDRQGYQGHHAHELRADAVAGGARRTRVVPPEGDGK